MLVLWLLFVSLEMVCMVVCEGLFFVVVDVFGVMYGVIS